MEQPKLFLWKLLTNCANIYHVVFNKDTAKLLQNPLYFLEAVDHGDLAIVTCILLHDPHLTLSETQQQQIIESAQDRNILTITKLMNVGKINVSLIITPSRGQTETPLDRACDLAQWKVVRYFLNHLSYNKILLDIDQIAKKIIIRLIRDICANHAITFNAQDPQLQIIIDNILNPKIKNTQEIEKLIPQNKLTTLLITLAEYFKKIDLLIFLIEKQLRPMDRVLNAETQDTLCHQAVRDNNYEAVSFFKTHAPTMINAANIDGDRPLHLAAAEGNINTVRLILGVAL